MCDLMWSDPLEEATAARVGASEMHEWYARPKCPCKVSEVCRFAVEYVPNPMRGVGQVFGYTAVERFLMDNGTSPPVEVDL